MDVGNAEIPTLTTLLLKIWIWEMLKLTLQQHFSDSKISTHVEIFNTVGNYSKKKTTLVLTVGFQRILDISLGLGPIGNMSQMTSSV